MAVEPEDLPLRLEQTWPGRDRHVGDGEDGGRHLAGDEPPVDERVQPVLIVAQVLLDLVGGQAEVGRPDRLVRLLGVLAGRVAVGFGGQVLLAVLGLDQVADAGEGLLRDSEAVGTHVGDETDGPRAVDVDAFVKLLGDLHRLLAREPQPDGGLLLERARLERRVGLVELLGLVHLGDDVRLGRQHVADLLGFGLGLGGELGAFVLGQSGLESFVLKGRAGRADVGGDLPEFFLDEGPNLHLAVDDQPDGHRLHPPGAQVAGDLAPEQGAELIAHETVEEPPRLLGVDHVHVDRPDLVERLADGPLGDLVKGHAADPVVGEVERLLEVPGDGLPLAIRVGRQIDDLGPGGVAAEVADRVFLGRDDLIRGRVPVGDVEPELALGEVADVAHARLDDELGAQEFIDRLGLLGALDDHQRGAVAPRGRSLGRLGARGLAGRRLGARSGGLGGLGLRGFGGRRLRGLVILRRRRGGGLSRHVGILSYRLSMGRVRSIRRSSTRVRLTPL